jgi:alanine or glycine:cation symporter, AGCS family
VDYLQVFVDPVNTLLWNYALIPLLLGVGLYISVRTRLVQFRYFGHMWQLALGSGQHAKGAKDGISSFQAFCIGLASRVGTGNIAGVAIAIALGGPGAIFWMWCVALVGMATAFIEATLAQLFKVPMPDGTFRGGPAFYIETGLGSRGLGLAFSGLLIFTFGIAFNAVQANTIADVLRAAHTVDTSWTAGVLVVLAAPVFFGGTRAVARVAEWLLPLMALAYLGLAALLLLSHLDRVPHIFNLIITSAFGIGPAAAGITGGIASALLNGVKRGLFSNEAGMGSAPNAAATATTSHPAIQGFLQSLGVFVDTILICSATAFIVLASGLYDPSQASPAAGASMTQAAVTHEFGRIGEWAMTVIVFAFAFSSVLSSYAYVEASLTFIKTGSRVLLTCRIAMLVAVLLGSVSTLPLVWALADVSMGLMALVNLAALLLLFPWARGVLADYDNALSMGRKPVFRATGNSHLPKVLKTDVW